MVQKNDMFCQREEVTGWKLPSVHVAFEFHTGVSGLKFSGFISTCFVLDI